MAREIKFRAWDLGKKVFIPNGVWAVVTTDFKSNGVMLKDWEDYREGEYFYEQHQAIQQFTGLLDKNGKEIYEGDIIKFQKFANWDDEHMCRHLATVIFEDGCFMWSMLKDGHQSSFYYAYKKEPLNRTNPTHGLEIIGNIYENREFLK